MDPHLAPTEAVGPHEFRNRFGYYLERAAAGVEIAVSRHGRPYARLGPVRAEPNAHGVRRRLPHKIARS